MNLSTSNDVQARVAALAKLYAEQLPQKIAEMHERLHFLASAGWDQSRGEDLYRMLHSMAGTAGTMGLPNVSQAARQAEQILKGCVEGSRALQAEITALHSAFADLQHALQEKSEALLPASTTSPALQTTPMRVLVVDDDPLGQALLVSLLTADGHQIRTASDGVEAIARFEAESPDLVLMDVIMPNMNGYEAARRIKARCGKNFVPVIFLTALQDENDLAQCIAAGGDDFIVKPYNRVLLKAKIIAMQRIQALHQELAGYQQRTAEEIALSQHIFNTITNRNPHLAAVRQAHSAVGHFSGDIVLFARSPSGRLILMLGDFTGHGLGAALAALPVSDVFYELVADEVSLSDLVSAINRKLKSIMPMGRFCAALLLEIQADAKQVRVWNGGIPGAYVLNAQGEIQQRLTSSKLPMGIMNEQSFDAQTESVALQPGEHLLLFTDGVNESRNPQGAMLGLAATESLMLGNDSFVSLERGVIRHLEGLEADDDISILAISPQSMVGG